MSPYIHTLFVYVGLLVASKLSFYIYKKIKMNSFELYRLKLLTQYVNLKNSWRMIFSSLFN